MKCQNCGTEQNDAALFCTNCGKNLIEQKGSYINQNRVPLLYLPVTKHKNRTGLIVAIIMASVIIVGGVVGLLYFYGEDSDNRIVNKVSSYLHASNKDDDGDDGDDADDETKAKAKDETKVKDKDVDEKGFQYSYTDYPDVISIDSDDRFTFEDYGIDDEVFTYKYQFVDSTGTTEALYSAMDTYCSYLETYNDFVYQQDLSDEHTQSTGEAAAYYCRDDLYIAVIASEEDGRYYAYISFFNSDYLSEYDSSALQDVFPVYMDYLVGRDITQFTTQNIVTLENGMKVCVYDLYSTDNGDGTLTIKVGLDISCPDSEYASIVWNDFLMVPYDAEGNLLSDACYPNYISDISGNTLTFPFSISSEPTLFALNYTVPADTADIEFYCVNLLNDSPVGPVYALR